MPGIKRTTENVSQPSSENYLENIWQLVLDYEIFILILLLFLGGLFWGYKFFAKKQNHLQRIWLFILFFLTKRQMMIPLVIKLAEKDNLLEKNLTKELLDIRKSCRDTSLKTNCQKRLMLERKISAILYTYFSSLESQNKINPKSKFAKIIQDLEFIDEKLIQLERLYNTEVTPWNQLLNKLPFLHWFHFKPFEKFEATEIPHSDFQSS